MADRLDEKGSIVDPPMPPSLVPVLAAIGGTVGLSVAVTAPDRFVPEWIVWTFFASTLTAAATVIGVLGWRSWLALSGPILPLELHRPAVAAAFAIAVISGCVLGAHLLGIGLRGPTLVGALIAGAAPCLTAMIAAGRTAAAMGSFTTEINAVDMLSQLQLLLRRMLSSAGALVALSTLALGAALRRSEEVLGSSGGDPLSDLLPFAGISSVLIAMTYVPATAAVRRALGDVLRTLFPLKPSAPGDVVVEVLTRRQEARALAIGNHGVYDDLTASLIVASPLITAALQRFLPQS